MMKILRKKFIVGDFIAVYLGGRGRGQLVNCETATYAQCARHLQSWLMNVVVGLSAHEMLMYRVTKHTHVRSCDFSLTDLNT